MTNDVSVIVEGWLMLQECKILLNPAPFSLRQSLLLLRQSIVFLRQMENTFVRHLLVFI